MSTSASTNTMEGDRYVCAWAGSHHVAFAIAAVQEVLAPRAVTRLFHAPSALLGVVNLRGEILPVLDLAHLLGDPPHVRSGGGGIGVGGGVDARSRVAGVDARSRVAGVDARSRVAGVDARSRVASLDSEARLVVLRVQVPPPPGNESAPARVTPLAVHVAKLDALRDSGHGALAPLPAGVPEAAARFAKGLLASPPPAAMLLDPARLVACDELSQLRMT